MVNSTEKSVCCDILRSCIQYSARPALSLNAPPAGDIRCKAASYQMKSTITIDWTLLASVFTKFSSFVLELKIIRFSRDILMFCRELKKKHYHCHNSMLPDFGNIMS